MLVVAREIFNTIDGRFLKSGWVVGRDEMLLARQRCWLVATKIFNAIDGRFLKSGWVVGRDEMLLASRRSCWLVVGGSLVIMRCCTPLLTDVNATRNAESLQLQKTAALQHSNKIHALKYPQN